MSKCVVIIRGKVDEHDKSVMQQYIEDNQLEVIGDWFYDYRSDDTDWAFDRYEDRLAFLKGIQEGIEQILVEDNFFSAIGQTEPFEQKLVQEVIRKIGYQLVCVSYYGFVSGDSSTEKDAEELFQTVMRYEKLRLTLSRIRSKQKNQEQGIVNLEGIGKISGRKSYLEKDPELVKKVRQLRLGKHTNSEISKILYNLGYKTQTGKPFGRGMITRLYQQSELLPVEEKEQILEEMRGEYRT